MSAWAKTGVKCVCVDATFRQGGGPLVEGRVYEIVRVLHGVTGTIGKYRRTQTGLVLAGVVNPYVPDGGFAVERFRPVVSRTQEQDLAIFRPILTSISVGEDA